MPLKGVFMSDHKSHHAKQTCSLLYSALPLVDCKTHTYITRWPVKSDWLDYIYKTFWSLPRQETPLCLHT